MVPLCSNRISRVPPYSRIQQSGHIRGYHPLWPDFPDRSAYNCRTTGLFRVRSPLLAESLLMSFPPGTEMFQFPGFASTHYVFMCRYLLLGGLPHSDIHGSTPARGSPWLFAACHVLHRLLVPRHPPNALLALEIKPAFAGRYPPCTGAIHTQKTDAENPATRQASNSAHTFDASERYCCCRWPFSPLRRTRTGQTLRLRKKRLVEPLFPGSASRDAPEPDSH